MENPKSKWIATDYTICYHSCGMNVLVEEGWITRVQGLKDHPLNKGRLCPKGARAIELVYHPDRLKYPLKKVNGEWKGISWDNALIEIVGTLQSLKKEFGPENLSIFSGSIGVENLEMTVFWKELAKKMGLGDVFPWETDEELIELELKPSGLRYKELKEERVAGAYYMPKKYGMEGYEVKGFSTPSKKIEIYSETFEKESFDPLPTYREPDQSPLGGPKLFQKYPLILTTGARNLYYTHTQHRNIKGLTERNPEPFAEIHKKTAEKFGIRNGDSILVESNRGQIKVKARITDEMLEGVVSIPHGWSGEANVNLLTDVHCREPIMSYPQMKFQLCSIRKA